MAVYGPKTRCTDAPTKVYRVIDDGICVLTTLDAVKALRKLQEVLDAHEITWAWAEEETLQ